jgi:hypothetical protein
MAPAHSSLKRRTIDRGDAEGKSVAEMAAIFCASSLHLYRIEMAAIVCFVHVRRNLCFSMLFSSFVSNRNRHGMLRKTHRCECGEKESWQMSAEGLGGWGRTAATVI